MVYVELQERSNPEAANRELERALKEFRRKINASNLFDELRKRRYGLKPSVKKKLKRELAAKRRARRRKKAQENPLPF